MTVLRLADARQPGGRAQPVAPPLREQLALGWLSLARAAQRVRRGGDPEAIHDLRVGTRRLTASLSLWRATLPPRARRRAIRSLRRLRRRMGGAREIEVAVALLEERLATAAPRVVRALEPWVDGRRERRDRARDLARRLVAGRALRRLERRVAKAAEGIPVEVDDAAARAAAAHRVLELSREAWESAAGAAASGDDDELHAARVALKRFRYAAEAFEQAGTAVGGEPLRPLKELQETLGAIHDRALLRDLLWLRSRRWRDRGRIQRAQAADSLAGALESERRAALGRLRGRLPAIPVRTFAPPA